MVAGLKSDSCPALCGTLEAACTSRTSSSSAPVRDRIPSAYREANETGAGLRDGLGDDAGQPANVPDERSGAGRRLRLAQGTDTGTGRPGPHACPPGLSRRPVRHPGRVRHGSVFQSLNRVAFPAHSPPGILDALCRQCRECDAQAAVAFIRQCFRSSCERHVVSMIRHCRPFQSTRCECNATSATDRAAATVFQDKAIP